MGLTEIAASHAEYLAHQSDLDRIAADNIAEGMDALRFAVTFISGLAFVACIGAVMVVTVLGAMHRLPLT